MNRFFPLKYLTEPLQEIFSRQACPEPSRRDAKSAKKKYFLRGLPHTFHHHSAPERENQWRRFHGSARPWQQDYPSLQ
jgi:hypothetical protein